MKVEHKYFIKGKIELSFMTEQVSKHQKKMDIGAHSIFLGQVRSDEIEEKSVTKIIYSAYIEMAEKEINRICELMLNKYNLKCLHIYHSLGEVNAGEISFFVLASSSHRKNLFEALKETVDKIKNEVPIWKKEVFE